MTRRMLHGRRRVLAVVAVAGTLTLGMSACVSAEDTTAELHGSVVQIAWKRRLCAISGSSTPARQAENVGESHNTTHSRAIGVDGSIRICQSCPWRCRRRAAASTTAALDVDARFCQRGSDALQNGSCWKAAIRIGRFARDAISSSIARLSTSIVRFDSTTGGTSGRACCNAPKIDSVGPRLTAFARCRAVPIECPFSRSRNADRTAVTSRLVYRRWPLSSRCGTGNPNLRSQALNVDVLTPVRCAKVPIVSSAPSYKFTEKTVQKV